MEVTNVTREGSVRRPDSDNISIPDRGLLIFIIHLFSSFLLLCAWLEA